MSTLAGKLLRIDLTGKSSFEEVIPQEYYEKFISARGLGAKYLYEELSPGISPLSPENKLIMLIGGLGGTGLQGFSKWMAITKSPLTGTIMRSVSGGNFGVWLKSLGFDILIVEGRSAEPIYLYLDQSGVQFLNAQDLLGLDPRFVQEKLRYKHGKKTEAACIGLSGEKLVNFAVISSGERTASRGGVGTVMGSKNLKAIAINTAFKKPVPYDPKRFKELVQDQIKMLKGHPRRKTMYNIGTPYITTGLMNAGILPVLNFRQGGIENIEAINGDSYAEIKKKNAGCFGCITKCGGMRTVDSGPLKGLDIDGPEYESIYAFGPLLGITERQSIIDANALCDYYGIDTISTGVCVAFAFELYEKGILADTDTNGVELNWGSTEAVLGLIEKIAKRVGLGEILSQGVKKAAEKIGQETCKYAMHIKGLELPGYEPRAVKGYALSMATSNIGGSHMYGRPRTELSGKIDPFTEKDKGASIAQVQKEQALEDSLIACTFGNSGLTLKDYAAFLYHATGIHAFEDPEELMTIAERIVCLERCFNVREGFSRAEDTLPERMFNEPLQNAGPASGQVIQDFDNLLDEYYQSLGYSQNGIPTKEKIKEMELEELKL